MSAFHQYNPFFKFKTGGANKTRTWAIAGLTDAVTDDDVLENSLIFIQHTSAHDGRWRVSVSAGSFTVTSSDPEAATVTYTYLIL